MDQELVDGGSEIMALTSCRVDRSARLQKTLRIADDLRNAAPSPEYTEWTKKLYYRHKCDTLL